MDNRGREKYEKREKVEKIDEEKENETVNEKEREKIENG